jgi:hypothetical protein
MRPTSRNAKQITCGTRFGVLVLFAFSGMNNVDVAPCATRELPGSQVGAFTTVPPVFGVVRPTPRTAFYFIRSAMTGFIVSVLLCRNRVSLLEAFEGLEPDEGKLSRPVLRGPGREAAWLLGIQAIDGTRTFTSQDSQHCRLLHQRPSLPTLRRQFPVFVRMVHRYYSAV